MIFFQALNCHPPAPHRRQQQDIIRNPSGVTIKGIVQSKQASSELFITPELLDVIIRETNSEANRICTERNVTHPDNMKVCVPLVLTELKVFVGLLLIVGVYRAHVECCYLLFAYIGPTWNLATDCWCT